MNILKNLYEHFRNKGGQKVRGINLVHREMFGDLSFFSSPYFLSSYCSFIFSLFGCSIP